MKTFNSLKEFLDYVPNCVVCQKPMQFILYFPLRSKYATSMTHYYTDNVTIKFDFKDGLLVSKKHKEYKVVIDPFNNFIVEGKDLLNNIKSFANTVYKKCETCHFSIISKYIDSNYDLITKNYFPPCVLQNDELSYTMKKGRKVYITHNYSVSTDHAYSMFLYINNKTIPNNTYIDFEKLNTLKQINKRISTILTFF